LAFPPNFLGSAGSKGRFGFRGRSCLMGSTAAAAVVANGYGCGERWTGADLFQGREPGSSGAWLKACGVPGLILALIGDGSRSRSPNLNNSLTSQIHPSKYSHEQPGSHAMCCPSRQIRTYLRS
jgi:hypothetical protein